MELHPPPGPGPPRNPGRARAPAGRRRPRRLAPVVRAGQPRADRPAPPDLAALAASLNSRAAAREQRLHLDRGHSRRARTGPAAPFRYTLQTQLLAAICHHRLGMPYPHIAALLGAHHTTIAEAGQAITALLGPGHPALAPGPVRVRTPADLRTYAATTGITIPGPPQPGRLRK